MTQSARRPNRSAALKRARLASTHTNQKRVVSVRMSKTLLLHIKEVMQQEGLGPRKRSYWISDALIMLEQEFEKISFDDQCLFIRQAQSVSGQGAAVPVTINNHADKLFTQRLAFCAENIADIGDAQSRLIHLAITLKLVKLGVYLG